MRAPSERDDRCQAKLDIMVDAFMRDDWATYSDAAAWLRDFTHQKNIERGRVKSGGNWFMPQKIEAVRKRARNETVCGVTETTQKSAAPAPSKRKTGRFAPASSNLRNSARY
jgi:hypothetical protein